MSANTETFWNANATARDFVLITLGLLAGAVAAALLLAGDKPAPSSRAVIDLPTGTSGFVTMPVGTYQIAVADSVLWRINTGTGEIQACGAGESEDGQLSIVCSVLAEQVPTPNARAPARHAPSHPKQRPASW